MAKTIAHSRQYRGAVIWYDGRAPGRLAWTALEYGAADTLEGMKRLIRRGKGLEA
jgi:hypothetical protein